MTTNDNDQMMTQADFDREDQQNGIERWVNLTYMKIGLRSDGSSDYQDKEFLYRYDLPRDVYERRKWVITWRLARLQCQFPKNTISLYHYFYDKKTNITLMDGPLTKSISAKRMITTILNKMAAAKKTYTATLFNPTIETTEPWIKAADKLHRYETQLASLQQEIALLKKSQ